MTEEAKRNIEHGEKYPYDANYNGEVDWAHRAARGILHNLCDRRGVGDELEMVAGNDSDLASDITQAIANIIRVSAIEASDEPGEKAAMHVDNKGYSFTQTFTSTVKTDDHGKPIETQTFQFDVHDEVQEKARVVVSVGPRQQVDDFVEVTIGVNNDGPVNGELAPFVQIRGPYEGGGLDIYGTPDGFKVMQEGFGEDDFVALTSGTARKLGLR